MVTREQVERAVEWAPIPAYKGYEASSDGQVRNVRTGRVLSPAISHGYERVSMPVEPGTYKNESVHRLVLAAFGGPGQKAGVQVNHKNGVKTDNRVHNLEWTTPSENVLHAFRNGLKCNKRGADHGQAKLNSEAVKVLWWMSARKRGRGKLATRLYGVSDRLGYRIRDGERWSAETAALREHYGAMERPRLTKLNPQAVTVIRHLKAVRTNRVLSGLYGISTGHVTDIQTGYRAGAASRLLLPPREEEG